MNKTSIGWIGAGIMGRPMVLNLLRTGYPVTVFARRREQLEPLIEAGARAADSIAQVSATTEVSVVMVADTPDMLEVVTESGGLMEGASPGHTLIDMSTVSPTETRRVAEQLKARDIAMLDAPVSGGEVGAIEGNLSIMVGGPETVFQKVRPIFEVLGGQIRHIGAHGAGQVAKACNQLLVAQTMTAIAEAYMLAESSGVSRERVREALLGGFAYSRILEVHGARMLSGDYQPGFRAQLHLKDLRIVAQEARNLNLNLPGSAATFELMDELVRLGDGELDSAALAKIVWQHAHAPKTEQD